jgi:hypothetical protein
VRLSIVPSSSVPDHAGVVLRAARLAHGRHCPRHVACYRPLARTLGTHECLSPGISRGVFELELCITRVTLYALECLVSSVSNSFRVGARQTAWRSVQMLPGVCSRLRPRLFSGAKSRSM